jgi:fermentation-respiration switch protein FrsA (DUF1100 family)
MKRILAILAALVVVLLVAGRFVLVDQLGKRLIVTRPQGPQTPSVPFEALTFQSGGRTLHAFWVPADGPGLLIFHGNAEAISSWSAALNLLHERGIAAMVFDYSGYGASQGEPSVPHFHEDGIAAWRLFREKLPPGRRACAYGLSLGSAVLFDVAPEIKPDCVAVSGAFLSVREVAVIKKVVPRWFVPALPDLLDSLENITRYDGPVLLEAGTEDRLFPPAWAGILAAAHPGAKAILIPGMGHGDPQSHPTAAAWDPVIEFVSAPRTGAEQR